jgi:hypothetical protein
MFCRKPSKVCNTSAPGRSEIVRRGNLAAFFVQSSEVIKASKGAPAVYLFMGLDFHSQGDKPLQFVPIL